MPVFDERPATWSDAEQLTFDRANAEFSDVSRDGRTFLFSSDRSGNHELYMMSLMDGETVQLTTNPSPDWSPRLSPDGDEVLFYSSRSGNRDIWILPLNGDPARQITATGCGIRLAGMVAGRQVGCDGADSDGWICRHSRDLGC